VAGGKGSGPKPEKPISAAETRANQTKLHTAERKEKSQWDIKSKYDKALSLDGKRQNAIGTRVPDPEQRGVVLVPVTAERIQKWTAMRDKAEDQAKGYHDQVDEAMQYMGWGPYAKEGKSEDTPAPQRVTPQANAAPARTASTASAPVVPAKQVQSAPSQDAVAPPKAGEVRKGYRFKGGDPADKSNWTKVPVHGKITSLHRPASRNPVHGKTTSRLRHP
jgi:hypothetical protein